MDFTNENAVLWNFIIQMGLIAAVLIAANVIRRKVPGIKQALMPTAVIAGFIALILRTFNIIRFDVELMEMITYHTIAIGFIALSLIIPKKETNYSKAFIGSKTGALIASSYMLQGVIGLSVAIGFAFLVRPDFFMAAGILLPMGFGQGPGQANNVGSTYEALGFIGGQSFALSIAASGFLIACTVGVIYLNILRKKGILRVMDKEKDVKDPSANEEFETINEIPISESIDRFSVQIAFVFVVYFATWLFASGLTIMLRSTGADFAQSLIPIIWGFNFVFGSLLAVLFRGMLRICRKTGWMKRQYQNNYLLARISGWAFDLMIVTGITTINFERLSGLWVPFILMISIGSFCSFIYLKWICKKLYPAYYHEGFISIFGMMTGVISSGILLLREADPNFKTPAASNLVLGTSFAIGFAFPMLILIGLAPRSNLTVFITLAACAVYFFVMLGYLLLVKPRKKVSADRFATLVEGKEVY